MVFAVLNTSSKAYADIQGLSANNYYLTGYSGSKPYHYFNDELGNSTLENCEIEQNSPHHPSADGMCRFLVHSRRKR